MNRHARDIPAKLLVASCGNVMASGDAFGPMVSRELRRMKPPGVEVVELDIRPAGLIDHLEGRSCLIILDALHAPAIPGGEVLDIDWFDEARPALCHDDVLSTHGLGIAQQLELAKQLGLLPPVVRLIGMTVEQPPEVGQADSPWMSGCVARATEIIRGYTQQYTASNREPTHA